MYVRLAFAVAAHLEPEILIVDEVLAVGDTAFQNKCLGKMNHVAKEGRTVLFVSHNMETVRRLCSKAIILKNGTIQCSGNTDTVISSYLKADFGATAKRKWHDRERAPGDHVVRLLEVRVHDENNTESENFKITQPIGVTMEYEVLEEGHIFTHGVNVSNEQGTNIFNSHDVVSPIRNSPRAKGMYSATMWIPGNLLSEGTVILGVALLRPEPFKIHVHEQDVVAFNVADNIDGLSARGSYVGGFPGVVRPLLRWTGLQL
jgi:lipopolysaccharide transport system ATP-binding protein